MHPSCRDRVTSNKAGLEEARGEGKGKEKKRKEKSLIHEAGDRRPSRVRDD